MQRSNLKLERRRKAGAPQLDGNAVPSELLDAWVWAERISMIGLFVLAVGYTLFVVHELFVPVVTAWVMGAILRPIVELAERYARARHHHRVPRTRRSVHHRPGSGRQADHAHANGLLVSFPGADGMKTGFICDSGYNVVASATRDGRRLVAVVLGEQSRAMRRVRATDLLENGFKRYFWKSLFGTSIDGLAIQQASLTDGPPHLKDAICGVAKPKPSGTRKVSRKGGSKRRSTVSTGAN